jgi:hypothetical protein
VVACVGGGGGGDTWGGKMKRKDSGERSGSAA